MVQIVCDTPAQKKLLTAFEKEVKKAGGFLADDLTVKCAAGDFSLHCKKAPEVSEILISLPEAALPFLEDAAITLKDGAFQMGPGKGDMSAGKAALLETLLEILNLASKAKTHVSQSPWMLAIDHPNVLDRLMEGRPALKENEAYKAFLNDGDEGAFKVKTFFMTRTLGFEGKRAIMPFVDFVNHHPGADPFLFQSPENPSHVLALKNSQPGAGDQCFAQYSNIDAHEIFLNYGYVEKAAPFVRSVPLVLDLEGFGKINVRSRPGVWFEGRLPPALEPLRGLLPEIVIRKPGFLDITHLAIPTREAPQALKQVLAMLLRSLNPDIRPEAASAQIKFAERTILEATFNHYRNLGIYLTGAADHPAIGLARDMVQTQLAVLQAYLALRSGPGKLAEKT